MKKDSNCSELLIRYGKREVCKSKISVLLKMTITIVDLNLVPFAIPLQLKTGPVERRSLGVLVGEVVSDLCTISTNLPYYTETHLWCTRALHCWCSA